MSIDEILIALNGSLSEHQRGFLRMIFGHLEALEQHRHTVEDAITKEITKHEEALSLLCSIPGIDVTAAAAIIAEIGTDMSAFPDSQHICSWAGLSPGNNESAGKRKSAHITRKVLDTEYSEYNRLKNEKASSDADYFEKVAKRKSIEENISELKQKKENVFIAINEINLALQYIFFSRDRLCIEYKDHLYYLKVNGQFVHPRDVSSGERNIIAFCYFFTEIMNNVNIKDLYKKEMLLVIDDPICFR